MTILSLLVLNLLLLGSSTAPLAGPAVALAPAPDPEIQEWLVPWENTRPRDPYVDGQGRVWFCGQRGNYIGMLDPDTGEFERYELSEGTHPHNLVVDDDGYVWYAGNMNAHIGKLDPDTGEITRYPMPDPAARDPHTLVFTDDGDLWFTVQGGNFIGSLDTESGDVELVAVPTERARPYGIKLDADDRPWVVLFGSNKIATVDPATMELEEYDLPRPEARPRRMEITPDGRLWYVDYATGYLGRFDPDSGEFTEWMLPAGADSRPYGTAMDGEGRLWIAQSGPEPNTLVGFDPATEEFFATVEVPSGGGTIRHMYYHEPTNEVWFGADTNHIGRLSLP